MSAYMFAVPIPPPEEPKKDTPKPAGDHPWRREESKRRRKKQFAEMRGSRLTDLEISLAQAEGHSEEEARELAKRRRYDQTE